MRHTQAHGGGNRLAAASWNGGKDTPKDGSDAAQGEVLRSVGGRCLHRGLTAARRLRRRCGTEVAELKVSMVPAAFPPSVARLRRPFCVLTYLQQSLSAEPSETSAQGHAQNGPPSIIL